MASDLYAHFQNLPPEFLGNCLDDLTNGIFRWRTIKNLRCKKRIPETCFLKVSPRKILILRDPFVSWAERYARSKKI